MYEFLYFSAFAASETARESDEDNCMAALLNRMSVPKSMTPTPLYPVEAPSRKLISSI